MARLSAGERLMTRMRRVHGAPVVWSVPTHWLSAGGLASCLGLHEGDRLVLREELDRPGLSRAHRQQDGLVGRDGAAAAGRVAGVGGTGTLDVEHLDVRHGQLGAREWQRRGGAAVRRRLRDVGVDVDPAPGLQVAGQALGAADCTVTALSPVGTEMDDVLAVSWRRADGLPLLDGWVSTWFDRPVSEPRSVCETSLVGSGSMATKPLDDHRVPRGAGRDVLLGHHDRRHRGRHGIAPLPACLLAPSTLANAMTLPARNRITPIATSMSVCFFTEPSPSQTDGPTGGTVALAVDPPGGYDDTTPAVHRSF